MTTTNGRYRLLPDRSRGLLVIEFTGFFHSPEELAGYLAEKTAAIARLGLPPNRHLTLCDWSGCPPQSREVLEFLKASIDDPARMSRRLAIVVDSAIGRLQFRRIVTRPDARCFERRADALAWLTA